MEYNCEWLKHHINDIDPPTFPCEWAKENWHKTISQITEPFPCDNLREKWEGGDNYRTVLYTDGTFIINEKESDIVNNIALHGDAINVYPALDATHPYEFNHFTERYWNTESSLIKSVEFGSEVKPTMTAWWFASMGNLTDIDWTGLDTSEVVDMQCMFYNCVLLTDLDLMSFDTLNVLDMQSMFCNCIALTDLDLTSFDTSSVLDMSSMFSGCSKIEVIDLSSFNTSNITSMGYMFEGASSLQNLDLSSFDTSNVINMNSMFNGCTKLETLDLTSFSDSVLEQVEEMFCNCTSLKTIYSSKSFEPQLESENVFTNCTELVGGAGTAYLTYGDANDYTRIDNPPTEPGYFTAK